MKFEWNEAKALANLRKHRVSFEDARRFEFDTAMFGIDDDLAYDEERVKAYGIIGSKLHVMVYVDSDISIRVISLRKATRPEKREYENHILKNG